MRYYTALSWGYSLLLLFFFTESPLTPARNRKSLRRTGSDSPTTMLKTINEIPTIDIGGSPLDEQFEHLEEPDPLKSEEGSSSSLRSGESGIDVTDGFFSFERNNTATVVVVVVVGEVVCRMGIGHLEWEWNSR